MSDIKVVPTFNYKFNFLEVSVSTIYLYQTTIPQWPDRLLCIGFVLSIPSILSDVVLHRLSLSRLLRHKWDE